MCPAGRQEGASTEHPAPTKKVNFAPSVKKSSILRFVDFLFVIISMFSIPIGNLLISINYSNECSNNFGYYLMVYFFLLWNVDLWLYNIIYNNFQKWK